LRSLAALHHMDPATALEKMSRLLRPGGRLAIVGLARRQLPADLPWEAAAVIAGTGCRLTRTYWEQPAPTVWPPHTYSAIRRLAVRSLPGVRYRRHVLWRYSLVWTKPVP
jgi:SAM-dependent methyltransferase